MAKKEKKTKEQIWKAKEKKWKAEMDKQTGLADLRLAYFIFRRDLKKQSPEKDQELDYLLEIALEKMKDGNNRSIQDDFFNPLLDQTGIYKEKYVKAKKKIKPFDLIESLINSFYEKYNISRLVSKEAQLIKASLHSELQKFGHRLRPYQLGLFDRLLNKSVELKEEKERLSA